MSLPKRALVAISVLTLGCGELGDLPAGVCGNGVVEEGEDCDSPGSSCGAPESGSDCRWVCTTDPDCKTGWRCGIDQICRVTSGEFTRDEMTFSPEGRINPRVGDFDGDGYGDLASLDLGGVLTVEYRDSLGLSGTAKFQSIPLPPGAGKLTSNASDDLVHLASTAINVLKGEADRSMAPVAYSPIPVPETDSRFVILDAKKPAKLEGKEVSYFGSEILQIIGTSVKSIIDETVLFQLPVSSAEIITRSNGALPMGDLDDRPLSPCDEFLVGKFGDTKLHVFTPCKAGGIAWNHDANALPPVVLDAGGSLAFDPVVIGDLNGDKHLDLLIPAYGTAPSDPSLVDLYAAFGVGDGTFHSDAKAVPPQLGDGVAKLVKAGVAPPLAVGDVNEDGIGDILLADRFLLSNGLACVTGDACYGVSELGGNVTEARVAKINADDHLDVVVLSGARQVTFLAGTGTGLFNTHTIGTTGYPRQLVIGDFDGDFVNDVAIIEATSPYYFGSGVKGGAGGPTSSSGEPDSLSVLFGRAVGGLEAPVRMGELGSVEAMETGQLPFRGIDLVSDLAVLTRDLASDARSVAIFGGATNRQLQAPFDLSDPETQEPDLGFRAEVGAFSGDAHPDVAAFAFTPRATLLDKPKPRLWLLESTGEAALSANAAKPADMSSLGIDPCTVAPLRLDLEGDGSDELVLFGKTADKGKGGRIVVARAKAGAFAFDPPIEVPDVPLVNEVLAREGCRSIQQPGKDDTETADIAGQPLAGDVDGDGASEILMLVAGHVFDGVTYQQVNSLLLYRGGLAAENRMTLGLPEGHFVRGMALLDVDADPAAEVVFVSDLGVYAAEIDFAGSKLVITKTLLEAAGPGGSPLAPEVPFIGSIAPMLVADFNGDRLPDFVIASEFASQFFYSKPTRQ